MQTFFSGNDQTIDLTIEKQLLLTAEEFSKRYLTTDDKPVNGIGAIVIYKIDNQFFSVMGPRAGELMAGNGGLIEPNQVLKTQLEIEFNEETFNKLPLPEQAKVLPIKYVDAQSWGTYLTFAFIDETSFDSKESLQTIVNEINPSAEFYHSIFNYVIGSIRGWHKSSNINHEEKRNDIQRCYEDLKKQNNLLIDILDDDFFQKLFNLPEINESVSDWQNTPANQLIEAYKIGDYSERPHYQLYELDELIEKLDTEKGFEFFNHAAGSSLLKQIKAHVEPQLKADIRPPFG